MVNEIDKSEWENVVGKNVRTPDMKIVGRIADCVEEWDCAWNNFKTWLVLESGRRIYANKVGKIGETSVTLRCGL